MPFRDSEPGECGEKMLQPNNILWKSGKNWSLVIDNAQLFSQALHWKNNSPIQTGPFLLFRIKVFAYVTAFDSANRPYHRAVKIFKPFHVQQRLPSSENTFNLLAIVCHIGSSIIGGHYVTYVWNYGSWIRVDDDRITSNIDSTALFNRLISEPKQIEYPVAEIPYLLLYKKSTGTRSCCGSSLLTLTRPVYTRVRNRDNRAFNLCANRTHQRFSRATTDSGEKKGSKRHHH